MVYVLYMSLVVRQGSDETVADAAASTVRVRLAG